MGTDQAIARGLTGDLFADPPGDDGNAARQELAPGVVLLRGFALPLDDCLLADVEHVSAAAPFRHLKTPGGLSMSVAMTNCGSLGWLSDRRGYRYEPKDPGSRAAWPAMPPSFLSLAHAAAAAGGFADFVPDACLVNRYVPGARMTLHQDRNERDPRWPIVSVSLGLPAVFLLGGQARADRPMRVALEHGDVLVWGGPARLRFHGVLPVKPGLHAKTGAQRLNLTFRRAE